MANQKQEDYEEMTVAELKELADKRNIHIPWDANKGEIIAKLEGEEPKMAEKTEKNDKKETEETRQFQTSPGTHELLTKAEAEKQGFYWKEEEAEE